MTRTKSSTKAESSRVLRRAGVPDDVVNRIMSELPDVIEFDRDEPVYLRHGVTLGRLLEALADSP